MNLVFGMRDLISRCSKCSSLWGGKRVRKKLGNGSLDVIGPGLHEHLLRARVHEPEIMHQRARPHIHPVPSSELLLADQSMEAAVPIVEVAAREVSAQVVLLDPVEFKVSERFAVPASDDGEAVFVVEGVFEEVFLGFGGAGDAPCVGDAGLVHPVVEEVCVARVDVDVA